MKWRQGHPEDAMKMLERALAINQRLEREGEAIKNLSHLSLIARDRGDYDLSLKLNRDILDISQRRDDARGIAVAANTIAHQDELRASLEYFRRAAEAYRRVGDPTGEGPALANVGTTLVKLGELNAAQPPLDQALALSQRTHRPDGGSHRTQRTGRTRIAPERHGRGGGAGPGFAGGVETAAGGCTERVRAALAAVRRSQQRIEEAVALGAEALEQARRQGRLRDLRDALQELAVTGRHAEAYQAQSEATGIIDRMRDNEVRREAARIENEFEAQRRESELAAQKERIASLEQQASHQRSIRLLLAIALGTFVLRWPHACSNAAANSCCARATRRSSAPTANSPKPP